VAGTRGVFALVFPLRNSIKSVARRV